MRLGQIGFSCWELIFAIFQKIYPVPSIDNIFFFIALHSTHTALQLKPPQSPLLPCRRNISFPANSYLPWVPEVFLACSGNFRCWPKADTSSAVGRIHEDLTETGNRARKVSGTQGNSYPLKRWKFHIC